MPDLPVVQVQEVGHRENRRVGAQPLDVSLLRPEYQPAHVGVQSVCADDQVELANVAPLKRHSDRSTVVLQRAMLS